MFVTLMPCLYVLLCGPKIRNKDSCLSSCIPKTWETTESFVSPIVSKYPQHVKLVLRRVSTVVIMKRKCNIQIMADCRLVYTG